MTPYPITPEEIRRERHQLTQQMEAGVELAHAVVATLQSIFALHIGTAELLQHKLARYLVIDAEQRLMDLDHMETNAPSTDQIVESLQAQLQELDEQQASWEKNIEQMPEEIKGAMRAMLCTGLDMQRKVLNAELLEVIGANTSKETLTSLFGNTADQAPPHPDKS